MNDYIHTPDGGRIRWIRPNGVERNFQVLNGKLKATGELSIDQWAPPEPPDAA
jgi:hypothetical protein